MSEIDLPFPNSWDRRVMIDLQQENVLRVEDGNHGEYRPRPHEFEENGEVAFIRSADLKDGLVDFQQASRINNVAYSRITKGKGLPGDILVSHKGTVGTFGVVGFAEKQKFVCSPQTTFWRVLNFDILDRDYLSVYMRSPHFLRQFMKYAGETDMAPYVSLSNQRKIQVLLPPLDVQQKIGACIRYYDDLIETNRRRIKVLEEMARRIYREWFVDFKFPGHKKVKMVDSGHPDFGMIPEGWCISEISEILELKSGYAFKSKSFVENGKWPLVTIKNVHDERFEPVCSSRLDDVPENIKPYCYLEAGDVLMSLTGNVGRVCQVYGGRFLLNQRVAKVIPKTTSGKLVLPYCALNSLDVQDRMQRLAKGVAQPNLSPVETVKIEFLKPSELYVEQFEKLVGPMLELSLSLREGNMRLAEMRDLQLPRLISGELDVAGLDVNQITEEAVVEAAAASKDNVAQQIAAGGNS
jgi:type I restriction enzyme, S subunit